MHCKYDACLPYRPILIIVGQGEHGVGLGKKESLMQELGVDTVDVMRGIKRSLDPFWLMNPGKIFSAIRGEGVVNSAKAAAASSIILPETKSPER